MSAISPHTPGRAGMGPKAFHRNWGSPRTLFSVGLSLLAGALTLIACVPLFSVLVMLIVRGGARLVHTGLAVFTSLPPTAGDTGGGFSNALMGTVVMVLMAAALAVPIGVLAALYLAEYAPNSPLSTIVRFSAKVLTGLPSILAGVFAFTTIVALTGPPSALAAGVALALLMIPTIVLTSEEAIRMVPAKMRSAAVGMGATQAQVVRRVVLPTALPGILTGVMLAVARAAGETAPLIFTATTSDYLFAVDGHFPFVHLMRQTASLSMFIYNSAGAPDDNLIELAWTASLVLVIMVLFFNIGGQVLSRRSRPRS